MLYAFFLFWPANVIPVWRLITLLQFFIPLNMLFRSCCIGLKHYKTHIVAGLLLFVAALLTMIDTQDKELDYALLFLLSSLLDVISHALKESIVRTQPLNQEKFNYQISVAQLVVGILITPIILAVSKEYVEYDGVITDPKNMGLGEFMEIYFRQGFNCLVSVSQKEKDCNYSFVYLISYVFSIFVLQLSLNYVSIILADLTIVFDFIAHGSQKNEERACHL